MSPYFLTCGGRHFVFPPWGEIWGVSLHFPEPVQEGKNRVMSKLSRSCMLTPCPAHKETRYNSHTCLFQLFRNISNLPQNVSPWLKNKMGSGSIFNIYGLKLSGITTIPQCINQNPFCFSSDEAAAPTCLMVSNYYCVLPLTSHPANKHT